eukprot:TRINITY_DN17769_c1_g1_i1.p1 TRINITY_DN17769_c1_g1~~TRINITY_DN17769_c1_g1_i1.p1  ORF type:complete len:488 (+),score=91.34 TRINITY_DN17769_c1_g1_i1:42-1466(+)
MLAAGLSSALLGLRSPSSFGWCVSSLRTISSGVAVADAFHVVALQRRDSLKKRPSSRWQRPLSLGVLAIARAVVVTLGVTSLLPVGRASSEAIDACAQSGDGACPADEVGTSFASVATDASSSFGSSGAENSVLAAASSSSTPIAARKVLAGVTHWVTDGDKKKLRKDALKKTLRALHLLPGFETRVILLSNKRVAGLGSLVSEQVEVKNPRCTKQQTNDLCMPWETLRALRFWSTGGVNAACDLEKKGACGNLVHDYYIYIEDDIEVPAASFAFWAAHVDALYSRGFLLTPHRREATSPGSLTDCFDIDCMERTVAVFDDEAAEDAFPDLQSRVFLRADNPYAGCFFMTREQFTDYVGGVEWSLLLKDRNRPAYLLGGVRNVWGTREQAAGGLIWDPRFGPEKVLTHLMLGVNHLVPPGSNGLVLFEKVSSYEKKIDRCVRNLRQCKSVSQERKSLTKGSRKKKRQRVQRARP